MVRVEAVLDGWKTVRGDTIQAVEDFPEDAFAFKASEDLMTYRDLARHILDAGRALGGMLLDGEENFAAPDFREKVKGYSSGLGSDCTAAELTAALRASVEEQTAALRGKSTEWWAHLITRMDGQRVTRLEMLQMVKEHELTHRAQMFLYLRLKGIVPPTTRRRQAKK